MHHNINLLIQQALQTKFTFERYITENPFHRPLVKRRLTREIPVLIPDIYDEIVEACKECLPAKDGIYLRIVGL